MTHNDHNRLFPRAQLKIGILTERLITPNQIAFQPAVRVGGIERLKTNTYL